MKLEPLKAEHLERLYKPVGEIIVQWGLIDVALHYLAFAMFKTMDTTPTAQRWPRMFGYRLEKVESLFKKRKEFAWLRGDAKDLIKRVRHLQDLRDMVVHGAAVRYVADRDAVLFERIDQVREKQLSRAPDVSHVKNPLIVRFEQLAVASEDCTTVAAAMIELRQAVIGARDS
jgi:hypothetical protein